MLLEVFLLVSLQDFWELLSYGLLIEDLFLIPPRLKNFLRLLLLQFLFLLLICMESLAACWTAVLTSFQPLPGIEILFALLPAFFALQVDARFVYGADFLFL